MGAISAICDAKRQKTTAGGQGRGTGARGRNLEEKGELQPSAGGRGEIGIMVVSIVQQQQQQQQKWYGNHRKKREELWYSVMRRNK